MRGEEGGRANGPCFFRRGVVVKDRGWRARRRRQGRQQVSGDGWMVAILRKSFGKSFISQSEARVDTRRRLSRCRIDKLRDR